MLTYLFIYLGLFCLFLFIFLTAQQPADRQVGVQSQRRSSNGRRAVELQSNRSRVVL